MNGIRPFSSDPDDRCGAGRKHGQFAGYVHSAPQDEASQIHHRNPAASGASDHRRHRGDGKISGNNCVIKQADSA